MTGRARGRARGRGRGSAAPEEPQRRPGEQQLNLPPPQQPPGPAPGSGRSAVRGGTRGEVRPGNGNGNVNPAAVAAAAAQMQQMTLGTGDGMQVQRRDRRPRYAEPTTRPSHIEDKKGTVGKHTPILTNYFALLKRPDWHLYQYNVQYDPPVDNRSVRRALLYNHEDTLIGKNHSFDGMVLFLPIRLPDKETEVYSKRKFDDAKIRIKITLTNELPPNNPECMHMYNIIFKDVLGLIGMKEIRRQYFNQNLAIQVPRHKLEVWPGFNTAIGQCDGGIALCADMSFKILRTDTVLDVMYQIYNTTRQNFYEVCTKKLVGEIVLTRYNNKTYRIDDISWDLHPTNTFKKKDGSDMSYVDYFMAAHGKQILDMDQPLIVSRPKKRDIRAGQEGPIHLIPEFCTMTGLTDDMRSDFHVMKDLATHTRVGPSERVGTLNKLINDINSNADVQRKMGGWGLSFARNLLQVNGRVLPPEKIFLRGSSTTYDPKSADWSREMRGKLLTSAVRLSNWILLCTQKDRGIAQDFVSTLPRVAGPMGMNVAGPAMITLPDDRVDSYLKSIKQEVNEQTQLVVCILPTNRKDRYDAIKKVCCVEKPVPSQVIVSRTLSKKQMLMSVTTKVAIQLNCKLGGEAWAVEIPLKKTMFIGVDTYHDSANKGQSIGGVVCSINDTATRYFSRITRQHAHQELVDGLMVACKAALGKYNEVNGYLPDRICVYRDGVGDGQLAAVYEHEVPQLLKTFKAVSEAYNPKVCFIVVKKRINTRLFGIDNQQNVNPPPGTVVDNLITKPEWYDFFLVSQSVRQGTVTPTHFNVLWDTWGLKPDHIQRLAYKMTHLYYNWPGTIRVPAPCQYAHKLAFLIGQSVHKEPSKEICDRLFFL